MMHWTALHCDCICINFSNAMCGTCDKVFVKQIHRAMDGFKLCWGEMYDG